MYMGNDLGGGDDGGSDKSAFGVATDGADQLVQLQKCRLETAEIQVMKRLCVSAAAFEPALEGAVVMMVDT
jgi:hypothetical protein